MFNKKGLIALSVISGLFMATFSACTKKVTEPETIKIGAVVFLTGPQSVLGEEVKNAFTVALDEINQKTGINGKKLDIIYEDSKDSPKDAIMAFNRLMLQKPPLVIVTGDVVGLSLIPLADKNNIPLLATVAAGPEITQKSKWAFRVFVQSGRQGELMADYAYKTLKIKSVASLYINNDFGITTSGGFKKVFESQGGKIKGVESYELGDKDMRAQIKKLQTLKPEAIYVTGFGDGYGACIKQIREMGYKGLLLSDNSLSIPYFRQQTTPASEGAYFTSTLYDESSEVPMTAGFIKKYQEKFNSTPSFIGAFAYDALKLASSALEKGGESSDGIRESLLSMKMDGLVGKIAFDQKGDLDFPLVIKKIENGKILIVSGATAAQ